MERIEELSNKFHGFLMGLSGLTLGLATWALVVLVSFAFLYQLGNGAT